MVSLTLYIAQLTGTEDGKVLVTTYDWQSLFAEQCRKIMGIKKLHCVLTLLHHAVSSSRRGQDHQEHLATGDQQKTVFTPSGLSAAAVFVSSAPKILCPKRPSLVSLTSPHEPSPPRTTTTLSTPPPNTTTTSTLPSEPRPPKMIYTLWSMSPSWTQHSHLPQTRILKLLCTYAQLLCAGKERCTITSPRKREKAALTSMFTHVKLRMHNYNV